MYIACRNIQKNKSNNNITFKYIMIFQECFYIRHLQSFIIIAALLLITKQKYNQKMRSGCPINKRMSLADKRQG